MKTTLDKLVFLIINRLSKNKDALSLEDFGLLFEENPELKEYLCEKYLEMPVLEKIGEDSFKNGMLLMPAINVLMMAVKSKDLIEYLFRTLKENIQPFKEIYFVEDKEQHLVHGLDLFDISQKSIDETRSVQALNVANINQFFVCTHKAETTSNYFMMHTFYFDNHAKFDIGFETLFINNRNYQVGKSDKRLLQFNNVANLHISLEREFKVELKNTNEANPWELEKCFELIKYNLAKGKKSFTWDENKLATLLSSNNAMLEKSSKEIVDIMIDAAKEGTPITRQTISLLFVKNKKAFNEFMEVVKENKVQIYEEMKIMPEEKKDKFVIKLEELQNIISKYEKTDIQVTNICVDILKSAEFLSSEKALVYFAENTEIKFNVESIFYNYIPRVLDSYFSIPDKVRNDAGREFLKMTVEQLEKMKEQLKTLEYDILEQEMRKIKVFGNFLDNRFPTIKSRF